MNGLIDWTELRLSPWWEISALAFGLVVGSFANVCIHRLPLGESVVRPRSRCPRCRNPIAAHDNLPVLSWLLLRGRCRHCREPISVRYPAVEAANGLLWMATAFLMGPGLLALLGMGFCSAMLVLALIDYDHQILPDVITLPGVVLGLAASFLPGPPEPLTALASAVAGYLACWAVAAVARRVYKQDALGQGDWKMVAMLGAWLGWERMLLAVFLASFAGATVGLALIRLRRLGRRDPIPLGTFLALGGVIALLGGESLVSWYRGWFGG